MRRVALGREFGQLREQPAVVVEQFLGLVALHPFFQHLQMLGFVRQLGQRHLVRAPGAFHRLAVHFLRPGPALGRAQNDHRPARPLRNAVCARASCWIARISAQHRVQRRRHQLVHRLRLVAFHEIRLVAVAREQVRQLLVADARQHRGIGDLVAVQVQDRQHRAVARRVQELVGMPAGRQRAGFRLAVAHHAADQQIRDCRTPRRRRAPASSPARRLRESSPASPAPTWLGMPPGNENCLNSRFMPSASLRDVRIELAVRPFQIRVGDQARPAVPGAGDVDHVQVVLLDQPVEMDVDEIQARRGAPVSQQPRLDVLELQRLLAAADCR